LGVYSHGIDSDFSQEDAAESGDFGFGELDSSLEFHPASQAFPEQVPAEVEHPARDDIASGGVHDVIRCGRR
jgi:hypothetical protein